jgi:hypothetical protein
MNPPAIGISVEGLQRLETGLKTLADGWVDLQRMETKIVDLFIDIMGQEFSTSGSRSGGWQPLSKMYAAEKARTHPGQPILRRDDHLFKALTSKTDETVRRPTKNSLEMGATGKSGEVGYWHQLGKGRLPSRKLMAMTKEDETKFGQLIMQEAATFARAEGFDVNNLGFSVL